MPDEEYKWHMTPDGPTSDYFQDPPEDTLVRPYPNAMWRKDMDAFDGLPYMYTFQDPPEDTLVRPYPTAMWRKDTYAFDGLPHMYTFQEAPEFTIYPPYPYAMWKADKYVNFGLAYHDMLPDLDRRNPDPPLPTPTREIYIPELDWTASMQQTFEYFTVDPHTWGDIRRLDKVKSSKITRDLEAETLGSATFDMDENIGETYIRTYLIAIQNGRKHRIPIGTHMVQTPGTSFDGKVETFSMDAYTPLIELKENQPPIGYFIPKEENIMDHAVNLLTQYARAPVVRNTTEDTLYYSFVAQEDDTYLSFLTDLIANAKYNFGLDANGRILLEPTVDIASMQPVWTYDDGNSSILFPDISVDNDMYGIPNVVEVLYSDSFNSYYVRVVNDDPESPISTVNRGREIVYRETNPNVIGSPTNNQIEEYANRLLRNLSAIEYTITYEHGYCPVNVGDCVRLNYKRAGLIDIKAKVVSQTINCIPGCPVSEKAVFTKQLWR